MCPLKATAALRPCPSRQRDVIRRCVTFHDGQRPEVTKTNLLGPTLFPEQLVPMIGASGGPKAIHPRETSVLSPCCTVHGFAMAKPVGVRMIVEISVLVNGKVPYPQVVVVGC